MWHLITEYHCFLSLQETRNYNYKIKYIIYIQRWQLNQSYLFFKTVFQSFVFFSKYNHSPWFLIHGSIQTIDHEQEIRS